MGIIKKAVRGAYKAYKDFEREIEEGNEKEYDRVENLCEHPGKYIDETLQAYVDFVSGKTNKQPKYMIYPFIDDDDIIVDDCFIIQRDIVSGYDGKRPITDEMTAVIDAAGRIISCEVVSEYGHAAQTGDDHGAKNVIDDLDECRGKDIVGYDGNGNAVSFNDSVMTCVSQALSTAHLNRLLRRCARMQDSDKAARVFEEEVVKVDGINPNIQGYIEWLGEEKLETLSAGIDAAKADMEQRYYDENTFEDDMQY